MFGLWIGFLDAFDSSDRNSDRKMVKDTAMTATLAST